MYDVKEYGAVGDGTTDDTAAVQAAIDACADHGGGRVLLPGGHTFRTGTVTLRSHVELHLEHGATLAGSPDFADYTVRFGGVVLNDGSTQWGKEPTGVLLNAEGAENIAVTGAGTIDGAGRHFVLSDNGYIYTMDQQRPFTVYFRDCTNVTFRDVSIVDGAVWTLRLSLCDDVVIHGIRIHNDLKTPNSDAIDLDCCRRVRISDCDIVAGDDAICLKACLEHTGTDRENAPVCEDVTVTGCTITTTSSALIAGVEGQSAIRNVVFSSCVIRGSARGLAVRQAEGGDIENILFSDITVETRFFHEGWWGRGEPIAVMAVPWTENCGTIRNVRFRNILCRSENGVVVVAQAPGRVEGLVFDDVRVEIDRWSRWQGGHADLRPRRAENFPAMPTDGFHLENAHDVRLRDCEVVWRARPDDARHALYAENCKDLENRDFRGDAAHPGVEAVLTR
ncbi:glycosyl hydrolase family 28 protein [Streptomyces sp. NBC_00006]|uniref:glycoside hydrolase family 28 protein n=1 Tax=unclassified Streptomyces TaxID=2593676 RepID=UPI002251CF2E|nr:MULTISPECIES: glycosyl hydrolase family 28 protein [unclassified Streptomyces]MCX5535788.1 glycosyl hydrolase family 28 protein [Streptomyces sp. NBC_00006]